MHNSRPDRYVLGLPEIDQARLPIVGGKAANLAELSRVNGIHVPAGLCVTTNAFQRIMASAPSINDLLDRLSRLSADDLEASRTLGAQIRRSIEATTIPYDLAAEITGLIASSVIKKPMPFDPARRPRICHQPPSRASRMRT